MAGNEFEKQVRGKINELRVQPSPAVWDNVEALIKKDKRRRWGIIFFFVFIILSGTGLMLSGIWEDENQQLKQSTTAGNQKYIQVDTQKIFSKTVPPTLSTHKEVSKIFNKKASTSIKVITPEINSDGAFSEIITNKEAEKENTASIIPAPVDTTDVIAITPKETISNIVPPSESKQAGSAGSRSLSGPTGKDSSKPAITIIKKEADKSGKWILGLTFTGGISAVSQNFGLSSSDRNSYTTTGSGSTPPIVQRKIRSSSGFAAGLTIRRKINSTISLGSGLNYQMFSTSINDQRNKYHYIQLPVELQIKLSNSKLPVYFNAAASLSVPLGSTDKLNTTTSSSNSFFNKAQGGIGTGLFINPVKKHPLFIGPYLYYGASSIATTGFYKDLHFSFIGLQTKYEFGKK